jgi:hypothetical protein
MISSNLKSMILTAWLLEMARSVLLEALSRRFTVLQALCSSAQPILAQLLVQPQGEILTMLKCAWKAQLNAILLV